MKTTVTSDIRTRMLILAVVMGGVAAVPVEAGYVFTNFDGPPPNDKGTIVSGINNHGAVGGKVDDADFNETGFIGVPNGVLTPFGLPHGPGTDSLLTVLGGINDLGQVVGNSAPSTPGVPGEPIQLFQDGEMTPLALPDDFGGTAPRGINNAGTIAGSFNDLIRHKARGFVRAATGEYTRFDATPTTLFTVVSGINNADTIVGNYSILNAFTAGYLRDAAGVITLLPNPAAIGGIAVHNLNYNGINDQGVTVGVFSDAAENFYGFLRDPAGNFTLVQNPIRPLSSALIGINNSGTLLGEYLDAGSIEHGFIAVPGATGDVNCDGSKNGADVQAFVLVLTNPTAFVAAHPNCPILNGDFDGDGRVTATDVPGMVQCLLNGFCP